MGIWFDRLNSFHDAAVAENMSFATCEEILNPSQKNNIPQGRATGFFASSRQMRQEAMFYRYPDKSGIPKMLGDYVLKGNKGGRESIQVNVGLLKGK
jgi:hypothetical protein